MKKIRRLIAVMLGMFIACSAGACKKTEPDHGPVEPEFTGNYIVKDGQSDYTILLSQTAQPAEVTAANELRDIIKKITGVSLEVLAENKLKDVDARGKFISIGDTALCRAQDFKAENLNTDGFC